jgi:HSP20 family molecular chaperone IbpA
MSLLPRSFHTSEQYNPFSRFLDEIAHYGRSFDSAQGHGQKNMTPFQPKFDVTELDDSYELHGELPGLQRKDIHVEFIEPRTLLISGKIERARRYGSLPEGWLGVTSSVPDAEVGEPSTQKDKGAEQKGDQNGDSKATEGGSKDNKNTTYPKMWVSERSVGEFSRTFNFPHHIKQDGTLATLEGGILFVKIPKTERSEGHIIKVEGEG